MAFNATVHVFLPLVELHPCPVPGQTHTHRADLLLLKSQGLDETAMLIRIMCKLRANWTKTRRGKGDQMWEGLNLEGIPSKERSIGHAVNPLELESVVTSPRVPSPLTSLNLHFLSPECRPGCPVPLE